MMYQQEAAYALKNKKGRKGKKGKNSKRRMGIPAMGGLSIKDMKKMQDMMSGLDDSQSKR